jgi:hypothetical protein
LLVVGGHAVAHVPQWLESIATFVSHPFVASPSQSSHPLSHAPIAHVPALQAGVACGTRHALPQLPQFIASVAVSTQLVPQTVPSQPVAHAGRPLAVAHVGAAPSQTLVHAPQCIALVSAVSQPLLASPSQSPHIASQAKPHCPPEHVATDA